jgi:hypothetical protein
MPISNFVLLIDTVINWTRLEKRCGAPLSHLILIDEKPLGKLVKQFNKTVANATRDLAERNETIAEFGTAIRQMETDMSRDVTERDERITELGGRIAELEGICRENEALEARIREGIKENEALKGRDVDRAQKNVGLEGTVVALRNHNHYMERKLNEHEGLPSGLCHTCNRIDPEEVAGGHYH